MGTKGRMTFGAPLCVTLNPMAFYFLCFFGSRNFLSIKEGGKRSITVNREIQKANVIGRTGSRNVVLNYELSFGCELTGFN